MIKKDLSAYKQMRFTKANKCPICGKRIFDSEQFEMEVWRMGHSCHYKFYHRGCYYGEREKEEAATAKQVKAPVAK